MQKVESIYVFRDYKAYLNQLSKSRGFKSGIASAARCQTAYISQILNGNAHLSLEQAKAISSFIGHQKSETRYFILLIELARAGTEELRSHFNDLIEEMLSQQKNLKERFKVKEHLSIEKQAIYYSDWTYAAVHMAVTVPKLKKATAMAQYLQVPIEKIRRCLRFLEDAHIVKHTANDTYEIGEARLHLGKDSPLLKEHHTNWRLQSLQSLIKDQPHDLHYTSIVSLSVHDAEILQSRMLQFIDEFNATIKPSPEEAIHCFSLDFFAVGGN